MQLPNGVIDPERAAQLWDRYLAEWQVADRAGLNVMINEHHQPATCLDPAAPVIAGVLARTTEHARILILGNPIANRKDRCAWPRRWRWSTCSAAAGSRSASRAGCRWEGRFFQQWHVNIWPRAYQQPHPPVWVTAMTAPSAARIADNGHVVASFLTGFDGTRKVFDAYRDKCAQLGRPVPGDDRFAYAALVYTGQTDEEGLAGAEKLMW
ncbi:LLM class flavin-dependent oxidoreductase [Amycolatopsis sp. NPDC049253]|uniref:LLM class flavin-dependent oxidoreductase n=1 Tax=Amycolatopsis sp. NPDC049253 TaxID=3155274 RepID=UPI00341E0527